MQLIKSKPETPRVLFLEDDPQIRALTPTMLRQQGFEVDVCSTVQEALHNISTRQYDALLSDLNVGQPGDGLTVTSAMRRTQPTAVTIILTGYPDIATALESISSQVDDIMVKPTHPEELGAMLTGRLKAQVRLRRDFVRKRVPQVIRENRLLITEHWLQEAKRSPLLKNYTLTESSEYLPELLYGMADRIEGGTHGEEEDRATRAAHAHGRLRRAQGFKTIDLVEEARLLQRTMFEVLQQNITDVDFSHLMLDLRGMADVVDYALRESVRAFDGQDSPEPKSKAALAA